MRASAMAVRHATQLVGTQVVRGVFLGIKKGRTFGFIRMDEYVETTEGPLVQAGVMRVSSFYLRA